MKVAIAQFVTSDNSVEQNADTMNRFIERARELGAEVIFFPELSLTGFNATVGYEDVPKHVNSQDIYVGLGAAVRKGNVTYNMYVILKQGNILYERKKYVLFKPMNEDKKFGVGEPPNVFELEDIKIQIIICYELRFPELFDLEAEVFVVPAAWPSVRKEHWRSLLRARAIENMAYVLGTNRWGPGLHGPFAGHSALVGPRGEAIELGDGEGLLLVEVRKEEVREARSFVAYEDRIRLRALRRSSGRQHGTS